MTLNEIQPALDQLRNHQQQLDPDGIMVGVSRQAIDEVLQFCATLVTSKDREAEYKLLFQRIEDGAWRNQWPVIASAMADYKEYFVQLAVLQDIVGITEWYEQQAGKAI